MKISEIIEKNQKSIILLDTFIPALPVSPGTENKYGKFSIKGTGFIISSDGKLITCAHVYDLVPADELPYLEVKIPGEIDEKGILHYETFKVKLLKTDKENDIALMQIISSKNDFKIINEFGNYEPAKEGDDVVFIGYPLATELLSMGYGITMSANRCIIGSVKKRAVDGSLHFFMVDTHINNGSSGSPVFSLESGKLVGIASGKISQLISLPDGKRFDIPANIGLCRPIEYVNNLIK